MRILHTSDWHLGRLTYRVPRAPDHDAVLAEILALARDAAPDVIVHSGDLFDGVRPGYDDLARGVEALRRLAAVAPVVAIAGNHDSPALLRVCAALHGTEGPLVRRGQVRFVADPALEPLVAEGPGGERAKLACLPFVHHNRAIPRFEADPRRWAGRYMDWIAELWGLLERGMRDGWDARRDVGVLVGHVHLEGALLSGSERPLTVGEGYAARPGRLPGLVSYCAFGHIHRPQALPGGAGRYAGSPIPLDFGEEGERKEVVLVEARPGARATATPFPLTAGRPLRRLEGTLEELAARAREAAGCLCRVVVRAEEAQPDLSERVRRALPEAVILEVEGRVPGERHEPVRAGAGAAEERPLEDLFAEYAAERAPREATTPARLAAAFRALRATEEAGGPPDLPALAALRELAARREGQDEPAAGRMPAAAGAAP